MCLSKKIETIKVIAEVIIAFGAIFGIIIGIATIKHSNESLTMTKRSLEITQEQFILANRPYLHGTFEQRPLDQDDNNVYYGMGNLKLKNTGIIPASIITERTDYCITDSEQRVITDIKGWYKTNRGAFPEVSAVFREGNNPIPLRAQIGKRPDLVYISAIIPYTGVDPKKIYWYKFNRLFHLIKSESEPSKYVGISILKTEEEWDRNTAVSVPKFQEPDWEFWKKKLNIKDK